MSTVTPKFNFMIYDLNFFIRKYELIPANLFCEDMWREDGARCYIGHCEEEDNCHVMADILWKNLHVSAGDLVHGFVPEFQQPCLKERILAALYDIQAKGAVEEVQSIINDRPETHEDRVNREDRMAEKTECAREDFVLNWKEGK